jgi:CRP/FNR family cyclic AMP-dependent transcriptional regulator
VDAQKAAVKKSREFSPAQFLETAARGRIVSTYPAEEIIYTQGDDADAVFYIRRGRVKITVVSPTGKEAVIALLKADEFFGEGCLIEQTQRLSTAVTITECEIMQVDKLEMNRVLEDEPAFSHMFVAHILARSSKVEEDLIDQLFNSTEKRLARALLVLANFGREGRPEPIIKGISQEVLAEMIGSTRSRVNQFMNKFRDLGFISYNGKLEIHASLLSVVLNDRPARLKALGKPSRLATPLKALAKPSRPAAALKGFAKPSRPAARPKALAKPSRPAIGRAV